MMQLKQEKSQSVGREGIRSKDKLPEIALCAKQAMY